MSKYYHKDDPDTRLFLTEKGDGQGTYKDNDGNMNKFPDDEIIVRQQLLPKLFKTPAGTKIFKSKDEMLEYAKANGHKFYVAVHKAYAQEKLLSEGDDAWQIKSCYAFLSFPDIKSYIRFVLSVPADRRHFFEMSVADLKFYCDFDGGTEDQHIELRDLLIKYYAELGLTVPADQIKALTGSRPDKISTHLIVNDGHFFKTIEDMARLGKGFIAYVQRENRALAGIVDDIWNTDRNFRAPGCSKADDKTNTPMTCPLLDMNGLLRDQSYLIHTDGGEGLTEFKFTQEIAQVLEGLGVSEPVDDSSAAANPAFTGAAGSGFDGATPVKPGKCDIPPQLAALLRNDPTLSQCKWQKQGFMNQYGYITVHMAKGQRCVFTGCKHDSLTNYVTYEPGSGKANLKCKGTPCKTAGYEDENGKKYPISQAFDVDEPAGSGNSVASFFNSGTDTSAPASAAGAITAAPNDAAAPKAARKEARKAAQRQKRTLADTADSGAKKKKKKKKKKKTSSAVVSVVSGAASLAAAGFLPGADAVPIVLNNGAAGIFALEYLLLLFAIFVSAFFVWDFQHDTAPLGLFDRIRGGSEESDMEIDDDEDDDAVRETTTAVRKRSPSPVGQEEESKIDHLQARYRELYKSGPQGRSARNPDWLRRKIQEAVGPAASGGNSDDSDGNYYDLLNIDKTATSAQIKKAYRDKAKEHHPDKGGDEEVFKKIKHAYDILSDADKRARYDTTGADPDDEEFDDTNENFDVSFDSATVAEYEDTAFAADGDNAYDPAEDSADYDGDDDDGDPTDDEEEEAKSAAADADIAAQSEHNSDDSDGNSDDSDGNSDDSDGNSDDSDGNSDDSDGNSDDGGETAYPHALTLKEAFEMNDMLGFYVFFTFAAELAFKGRGAPTEEDLNTVIGERESENKCDINIDCSESARACQFSNAKGHDVTLQYNANEEREKSPGKYYVGCKLWYTCDNGEGKPDACPCKGRLDITEEMLKAFCYNKSGELGLTFLHDKGPICGIQKSDNSIELYDTKHVAALKDHYASYRLTPAKDMFRPYVLGDVVHRQITFDQLYDYTKNFSEANDAWKQKVDFVPFSDKTPEANMPGNILNLFQGFAVTATIALQFYIDKEWLPEGTTFESDMEVIRAAAKEHCKPMLEHFMNIIAQGDHKSYEYFINFFAHMLQYPHVKPAVMLVLYSQFEGAGKNVVIDMIAKIVGNAGAHNYCYETANTDDIFGNFCESASNKLMLIFNETKILGPKLVGKWKDMMTRSTVNIHRKFCDIVTESSWHRFVMTTNDKQNVETKAKSRRMHGFTCSDKYTGPMTDESEAYFKQLINMDPCTFALFLWTLDVDDFNPRKFDYNAATQGQMRENWTAVETFVNEFLDQGCIVEKTKVEGVTVSRNWYPGGPAIPKKVIYDAYIGSMQQRVKALEWDPFFSKLWQLLGDSMERARKGKDYAGIEGHRVNCIDFAALKDLRAAWLETWYAADDQPAGWDEDIEADVDLAALPVFPEAEDY